MSFPDELPFLMGDLVEMLLSGPAVAQKQNIKFDVSAIIRFCL